MGTELGEKLRTKPESLAILPVVGPLPTLLLVNARWFAP